MTSLYACIGIWNCIVKLIELVFIELFKLLTGGKGKQNGNNLKSDGEKYVLSDNRAY